MSADIERLQREPEFRKATRCMVLAYAAAEEQIRALSPEERANLGLVVGSNHGEFHATREFLRTWADSKTARPLLFQNSLHNSTLGFLAVRFGIQGPGVTVSNGEATEQTALETARALLDDGLCSRCLVVCVDEEIPECTNGFARATLLTGNT